MHRRLFSTFLLLFASLSAADTLEERAYAGDVSAQYRLGEYYLRKSPPEERKAAEWFGRAARGGSGAAQYQLGTLYGTGRGVEFDAVRAYAWFELASATEPRAEKAQRILETEMSRDQIRQAEAESLRLRDDLRNAPAHAESPPSADNTATGLANERGGYWVQLGTFSEAANAEALAARARAGGANPILVPVTIGGQTLVRLGIGPYPDMATAEAAREQFLASFGLQGMIRTQGGYSRSSGDAPPASPPAPLPAATAAPSPAPTGGYLVQLGTFANPENAERLAALLREAGANPILESVTSGGRDVTRLRVGPYPDIATARAALTEFEANQKLSGWILPTPK